MANAGPAISSNVGHFKSIVSDARATGIQSVESIGLARRSGIPTPVPAPNDADLHLAEVGPPAGLDLVEIARIYLSVEARLVNVACPIVQIVSPGASTATADTSYALAWAAASMFGKSVLVVDANYQRAGADGDGEGTARWPIAAQVRGMPSISDVAGGAARLEQALLKAMDCNLFFAKFAPDARHAGGFRGLGDLQNVISGLRPHLDMVLIISPPVLVSPLATVLAATADGTIMVLQGNRTRLLAAQQATLALQGSGTQTLAVILTQHRSFLPSWLRRWQAG